MITSNISVNRACPVYTFKIQKNNQQTSFKGNVSEKQNQGMTQEQKTWVAVGLTTFIALAIGLIAWACSKGKKKNETRTPKIKSAESQKVEMKPKTNEASKTVEKTKFTPQKQVKELENKMQKHFVNVSLKQYNPKWDMVKTIPNVLADFEPKNDFSLYEQMVLVPQLLGRKQQLYTDKLLSSTTLYELHNCHDGVQEARLVKGIKYRDHYEDKPNGEKGLPTLEKEADDYADKNAKIKETFVEYLKLRSEYFNKDNEFDVVRSEMLKNPSDDVVDVETLRLHLLANNTRQFLYSDKSVEEPHEMVKFVQPLLIANYTAKMLEEFKPKKENLSENEKKYFEYMNKLGKFWHERLKKEASEKLPNFVKIITGEVDAPKCYTKGQEEVYDKRYIFVTNSQRHTMLSDILSSSAKSKWDNVMEKEEKEVIKGRTFKIPALKETIRTLEGKFVSLKYAVDKNDYSAQSDLKSEISDLTSEVLI